MTGRPAFFAFVLLVMHSLMACSATSRVSGPSLEPGYSLLYDLLSQDAHADKILWLKFESDELEALMREIVALCEEGKNRLDAFAEQDATLATHLRWDVLPEVEKAARAEIESETAGELVTSSGAEFELRLLLTQLRALRYASSLCVVLAREDENEARRKFLDCFQTQCTALREKVFLAIASRLNGKE